MFQKKHNAVPFIALALIIFLAGCVSSGKTKTEIISEDMLKIKSIDFFPSKDVQPGDTIIIRMEVENVGQESTHILVDKNANTRGTKDNPNPDWNGDYLLIDHCPSLYKADTQDADFQILSGGTCATITTSTPLVKDSGGAEIGGDACYLKIPPGQSHTFQWGMKAPTNEKIADMTHKCTFKFQIAYAAKAITNTYVYFADPIEVAQRLYTKKDMTLVGDNIASYGPVAVNFAPAEPQPIPARKDGKWTVFLNLKNVGDGIANIDDMGLFIPGGMNTVNCMLAGELNEKHKIVEIMTQDSLTLRDSDTKLMKFILKNGGAQIQIQGATTTYVYNICDPTNTKNTESCTPTNIALVKKYDDLCKSGGDKSFCESNILETKSLLEDAKNRLQIYSQTSSRIPCELTIPEGVVILSPFRFVTTADYTYSIRQDIQITTKPIRERA